MRDSSLRESWLGGGLLENEVYEEPLGEISHIVSLCDNVRQQARGLHPAMSIIE